MVVVCLSLRYIEHYLLFGAVANLGPQTNFPVPEGILNHNGINTLSMTLWSVDDRGAKLDTLSLEAEMPLWSGYRKPWLVDSPSWTQRSGAY